MKKNKLLLLLCLLPFFSCKKSQDAAMIKNPSELRYTDITDAREGRAITSLPPTVQTGGLIPVFELVSIEDSTGAHLDDSYLQYVHIGESTSTTVSVPGSMQDGNGNAVSQVSAVNSASNGIISIAAGHKFSAGDYYFTIKVTTEENGRQYSSLFEKGFHLHVSPLLPATLVYSPKNQNLVYGTSGSKTTAPLMPNANPDVSFELATDADKLTIDKKTGIISLASDYAYSQYDTLTPTVKVVNNISQESVLFENKLRVIITDKPEVMPKESIYTFYPTLNVNAAYPSGGVGYTIQTDVPGVATRLWGNRTNSVASYLVTPAERPAANTGQTILETCTFNGSSTKPVSTWMVTTTQDLTPFQYGFQLSFNYYYMPAYQIYMSDGRTPTDLEVYISTDYTGGDIQDAEGNWLNGTWTKVNAQMVCQRSEGVSGSNSIGAPWGQSFLGTPYPGDQKGADPDNKKRLDLGTFYGKWVKCSYAIPAEKISQQFTVAFKVASFFEGELLNNTTVPGRGGSYFISDFNYKATEPEN